MQEQATEQLTFELFKQEVLADYATAVLSRETSLLGRKEVLGGKAKFGIFGDGKEIAQIAMAKYFNPGDYRSGYYRDQTFMFASKLSTVQQFFAQLYANMDETKDIFSAGRQMNAHFATPFVDEAGNWNDLVKNKNVSSDIAPTAGQMVRALGLAFGSKCFRNNTQLAHLTQLSNNGNEVCFCTIGDASTSEGHFWETINAAGVLQIPLAVFVWDNGYGISVPKKFQTTKASISSALKGFQKTNETNGILIYKVKGWDYAGLCEAFEAGLKICREEHVPVVFHVEEITQPQGHSTSGSHERYKTKERLDWEAEWDGIKQFKQWIIANALGNEEELEQIDNEAKEQVKQEKNAAWEDYINPIKAKQTQLIDLLTNVGNPALEPLIAEIKALREPLYRELLATTKKALQLCSSSDNTYWLQDFCKSETERLQNLVSSHLYNQGPKAAVNVPVVQPVFTEQSAVVNGFEVLNKYFDNLFTQNPKVFAFGEDVGQIGDVNQGFSGLQEKHGKHRIFDTGIRELTIAGQGIGLAMRGLRPIAEIQYLDYLLYALQPLSDDVATLHYRTKGQQSCPLIVRTRGHRLEGIWHSGSPMGMIINSLRGMYVCVPRNMVQAVGMYNTLLQSNDPGLIIECLNGYRLKEKCPENLLEYTVPLGVPEIIRTGTDITIVSYGSTLRIVQEAAEILAEQDIDCEIVDVQTLLPFDTAGVITQSLSKTSKILFVDEDVPGGAAAYMYNQVLEAQNGFKLLDGTPRTLTAQAHRPSYGSDGDYFSKPNKENIVDLVVEMANE
jgi:pyruvate/2-oxoglutarate/acetoin dehydrogenase E1 component/TPP-dependent pyruvate/acetoin dehydrogenase alpha subunit